MTGIAKVTDDYLINLAPKRLMVTPYSHILSLEAKGSELFVKMTVVKPFCLSMDHMHTESSVLVNSCPATTVPINKPHDCSE